ncbi:MAG: BrnT family toxin [Patescibacteria group bacterium]
MKLPVPLLFDWDEGNLNKNWEKHKVRFKEAEEVFFNRPLKIFSDKYHSKREKRFVALGITDKNRNLITIFTIRKGAIRIISVRDQNRKERKKYEEK